MAERLYLLQRLTAILMVPLVAAHLWLILTVAHDGVTGAEILGRTQGSVGWGFAYGMFVLCAAIHAAIGVRNILGEWTALSGPAVGWIAAGVGGGLILLGLRAVAGLT